MTKNVVNAEQVAHLWANKSQDQARTPTGNFFFVGPELYSYGRHFAVAYFLQDDSGRILVNDGSYSNTTAKHQSHMRSALSRQQWERVIHVPVLDESNIRQLDRARRNPFEAVKGKRQTETSSLVIACEKAVIMVIASIAGFRSVAKMQSAFNEAKKYESSALALVDYVKPGTKCKYGLPLLPESFEAFATDKEARTKFVQSYAKVELLADSERHLQVAADKLNVIKAVLDGGPDVANYRVQSLRGFESTYGEYVNKAAKAYTDATGKKSAKVAALRREYVRISGKIDLAITTHNEQVALARFAGNLRNAHSLIRTAHGRNYKEMQFDRMGERASALARWLTADVKTLNDHSHDQFVARFVRFANFHESVQFALKGDSLSATADAYLPGHHYRDALRFYLDANQQYVAATQCATFGFIERMGLHAKMAYCSAKIVAVRVAIAHAEKNRVANWLSGESDVKPILEFPICRIKGDEIETTMGARVPLLHACRLARIARRVIAQGGRKWEEGAGPQVGGFRVSSIDSDGSTVIGCHRFEAAEALRMLAALDTCPECTHQAETDALWQAADELRQMAEGA